MKTDKLIKILGAGLFVSLAINLFMAGVVVGSSVNTAPKVVLDATKQEDQKLRDSLSDSDKLVLKQSMDVNREKIAKLHTELEALKTNMREIVKKEPMSEKELNAVLEAEKNKKLTALHLIHETREATMQKMSPEGRASLLKMSRLGFDFNDKGR